MGFVLGISTAELIPPGERRAVVSCKVVVVEVVGFRSSIEGNQVERVHVRNVVAGVDINGLKQADSDPGPKQDKVCAKGSDADEEASTQDEGLEGVGVLSDHAERSLEVVVDLVDVLVDALVV